MNGLTAREQRIVALGVLAAMVALGWLAVVSPILRGFSDRANERIVAVDALDRNARLIAAFGAVRSELTVLRRTTADYAFEVASPAAAGEAARAHMAAAVAAEGGVLQAMRETPAPPARVHLQGDMRIGLAALFRLIRRLESERPYAAVQGLSISAPDTPAEGAASLLEVRLDLSYAYAASL